MLVGMTLTIGGCASAKVNPTMPASKTLPRPDVLIVHDFAVTPSDVQLDKGIVASIYRDGMGPPATPEEVTVGRMVANKMSEKVVADLRQAGINAVRAGPDVHPTATSGELQGQFEKVNQGNQSQRVWVGFGLGGSELHARGEYIQNGKVVSQGTATTTSNLKPGMLASGAAAVATGGAAPLAVGAAATVYSEAFTAGVEADASRMAAEVARKARQYYIDRGWLPQ